MPHLMVAGGVALLTATTAVAVTSADVPAEKITMQVVNVNGTGCPASTAAVAVSPDNTAFTITYSAFVAEVGPAVAATRSQANCHIATRVRVPSGHAFAVSRVDFRGYAFLDAGASGSVDLTYRFVGFPTTHRAHDLFGPMDADWHFGDEVTTETMVYSGCGRETTMNISMILRAVVARGAAAATVGLVTMDASDAATSTTYHLGWTTCTRKQVGVVGRPEAPGGGGDDGSVVPTPHEGQAPYSARIRGT